MATHSSVLTLRIPGMGEPGGLPSTGLHRVGHDWSDLAAAVAAAEGPRDCHIEWNKSDKDKYHMVSLICKILKKNDTNELIYKIFVVQLLSHVWLFVTPWTAASLSFSISQSLLKYMFIESVMLSNHLIPCSLFSFSLQSFPASGSFPMSQLFA